MKLQEYHAKALLLRQGLPVPDFAIAQSAAEARSAAERFLAGGAGKVVIKAQQQRLGVVLLQLHAGRA